MNRVMWIWLFASLLSACGSSVKLNENTVPVEDRTGKAVISENANKSGGAGTLAVDSSTADGAGLADADAMVQTAQRIIYFDYDSAQIRPEFQSVLEFHAQVLKVDKNKKVSLEGHTDERGGREYNLALGQRRADAVRRALSLLGVGEDQLEAVSFGKEKPALPGSTEAAMEKNRRAEIRYK